MNNTNSKQTNIVGLVVKTLPHKSKAAESSLALFQGVEIHANDAGRLVVTVDDYNNPIPAMDTIAQINQLEGIISTAVVYHHFDDNSLNQNTDTNQGKNQESRS